MNPPGDKKLDPAVLVGKLLATLKHGRLMLLVFVFGLLVGLVFLIYKPPLYSSRSLVNVSIYALPVHSETGQSTTAPLYSVRKDLLTRLLSKNLLVKTAVSMGIAREGTSAENIKESIIPEYRIMFIDADTLQISVFSYSPLVVREFAKSLVEEFHVHQSKLRAEYRRKAMDKYIVEQAEISSKLDDRLDERSQFVEKGDLINLAIEQNGLINVPTEISKTENLIGRMDAIREDLEAADSSDVVTKLSILSLYDSEATAQTGQVVRAVGDEALPMRIIREHKPELQNTVVVQPDLVAPLYPWDALEKERRQLLRDVEKAKLKYRDGSPNLRALMDKIGRVEKSLELEYDQSQNHFNVQYNFHKEQLIRLKAKLPEYRRISALVAKSKQDYQMIEAGRLSWDKAYKTLAQKLAALQFGANKDRLELRYDGIVNLRDKVPVSPNKMKLLVISLTLGIAFAIGVPFIIEMMDTTTSGVRELELTTGLKGLGVVPFASHSDLEMLSRSKESRAQMPVNLLEPFRLIRTQIALDAGDMEKSQVVMVTSARPAEGKTVQSANLAWAFYSVGHRTLVIDADLRGGRLHNLLGVENDVGLTSLLTGSCGPEDIVHSTDAEHLDFVPRGPIIADVTEALCQDSFDDLISFWRQQYDRIVIDTPPVLGLSETASLQRVADGVVLVVKAESTSLKDVKDSIHLLSKSGAHFYGFVLNQVDLSKAYNHYNYDHYTVDYYQRELPQVRMTG